MTAFPSYSTGTVSVSNGGTTVTGVSTIWSGVNARPGDLFQIGAVGTFIADVTDVTHLVIPPWGGSNQAGAAYKIYQTSPLRFAGGQAMADVSALVAAINANGFIVFVPAGEDPDPSLGEDGQYATDQSLKKWWQKVAGVWTLTVDPSGFQPLGTTDSPQFAGVNVGHASDTTISRVSAGVIAVEGSTIATQNYVDSVAQGLDPKQSVLVATTANITLSGEQTIDGFLTSASRVLVKNQSTASQNGIYVSAAGSWTRALDADAWTELPGAFLFVEKGTVNADIGFVCTVDAGGTLGTTAVTFVQFTGASSLSAGTGISITGGVVAQVPHNIDGQSYTGGGDITVIAPGTHAATGKTTPVDADEFAIVDSAASNVLKKLTWANLKATIAAYLVSAGWIRDKLTANRTYFVLTTGSDSNTGLVNSAGGAFLTIQKAINVAYGTLDLAGFNVTIQLGAAGTFTGPNAVTAPQVGAGNITLNGDVLNSQNYIIINAASAGTAATFSIGGYGTKIWLMGFEVQSTGANQNGIEAINGAFVTVIGRMRLGTIAGSGVRSNAGNFLVGNGAAVGGLGQIDVVGNMTTVFNSSPFGFLNMSGATITCPVNITVTTFASADRLSYLGVNGTTFTVTGTVTGQRYSSTANSVLNSGAGGASFIPGSTAGSTATGGLYI